MTILLKKIFLFGIYLLLFLSYALSQKKESRNEIINYFIDEQYTQVLSSYEWDHKIHKIGNLDSIFPIIEELIIKLDSEYKENRYDPAILIKGVNSITMSKELKEIAETGKEDYKLLSIKSYIDSLPFSLDKIALLVQYGYMTIGIENYSVGIEALFKDIKSNLQTNPLKTIGYLEAEKATRLLGDFAINYHESQMAIQMYYLARIYVDQSKLSDSEKNIEQGFLCRKISEVFHQFYLNESKAKEAQYYDYAGYYFKKAGKIKESNQSYLFAVALRTNVNIIRTVSNSEDSVSNNSIDNNIYCLKYWYQKYKEKPFDFITNSLLHYSIANTLFKESQYKAALKFYIDGFFDEIFANRKEAILVNLKNIATTYSLIGNENLALKYNGLINFLSRNYYNSGVNFYYKYLDEAINLINLKKYDSASIYVNRIISDTDLVNQLFPVYYDELMKETYWIKFTILDLTYSDSALYYKDFYSRSTYLELESFNDLIQCEVRKINEWFDLSKEIELEGKNELISARETSLKLLKEISTRDLRSARDSIFFALYLTSIEREKRKLDSVNNQLKLETERAGKQITSLKLDSTQQSLAKEKYSLAYEKKIKSLFLTIGGLSFLSLLIGIVFYRARVKQRFNSVNELAKNKIHNIENDYSTIGNLLRENKIEKLKEYNKYYSSYLASFFDNWKKGKITLEDELKAFNRYANANKILIPQLTVSINSSIKNPEKVLFLQSVFDTLLDNSITHGFKDMESNFHFSIDIASGGNILTCVVVDNGIPPEDNNAYLATKNSGLSILRKRIQNSYSILKPWTHKGAFNIRTIPGNKGTIIKLVFPYEEA